MYQFPEYYQQPPKKQKASSKYLWASLGLFVLSVIVLIVVTIYYRQVAQDIGYQGIATTLGAAPDPSLQQTANVLASIGIGAGIGLAVSILLFLAGIACKVLGS